MRELKLHKIQTDILVELLLNPERRFSELNKKGISTDKFNFHVKKLRADGLIVKKTNGSYVLTKVGKEFANRYDTDEKVIEKQAKIGVRMICLKTINGKTYCLLDQRLKQPYWGYWGLPGGKIRWGEEVLEAAQRELKEETGLKGKITLLGVKHKMDYGKSNELLEDKYFFACRVDDIVGKLKTRYQGGRTKWMQISEISKLTKLFDGVIDSINLVRSKGFFFLEKKYRVKGY